MRNNFLYFGVDAAATQAFDNVDCSGAQTFQLTTGGFDNPIPTGVNFLANGGAKVTVTAHANHAFGSAYGSPAAGTEVDITAACTYHVSNGTVTVAKTGANGFTGDESTAANNDFDVTQLKPYVEGNGYVYNSKHLKGIAVAGATTTALNFQAKTGDANAIDILTVTHGSAKFKEFTKALTDVIADDNKVSGMVVVVDDMRSLKLPNDASSIASVAGTYDS